MPRRATAAVVDDAAEKNLDNAPEAVSEYRSGEVAQGDDPFIEQLARRAKWTPKEEWKRDPDKWVDAKTYLERLPDELETVKDRLKRTAQAADAVIEDERRRARDEALQQVRAAAEAGEPEKAVQAAQRIEQVAGPPPQVAAWIERNPWFKEDPLAHSIAAAESARLANQGLSIAEQLEGAERVVRQRFPEHFGEVQRREPTLETKPEPKRQASQPPPVQGGTRGSVTPPRDKGFADIPAGDRALYEKHFAKRMTGMGLSAEEAQKRYAANYWREKE